MTAKLRDHPLMKYRGVPTWPPVWTQERFDGIKKMKDEVGVLIYVHTAPGSHRCYLIISYENENYAGTLLFDSARFCQEVADLLRQHIGSSIKEIGDLDVSFTL
jgi:hypothetical protein